MEDCIKRKPSRVAIVHYWLLSMRGGEKVIDSLCRLFPDADIFTLVAEPSALSPTIASRPIHTSFLQHIGGRRHYQKMLPLMPFALESFDLRDYDLVISSESGPAKGIITRPDALHVCYCHSPMRYIWDLYPEYLSQLGPFGRLMLATFAPLLRQWDVTTAARVDYFIANSGFVRKRIKKYYRRDATVIHPPVDVKNFALSNERGDYYLCAGQVTPYKRIDLAIRACNELKRRLIIVGGGIKEDLRRLAGPTVEFINRADDAALAKLFGNCRALLYPGLEDFGIVPLEAAACGRPVIAYARGGALETVVDGVTGLHFVEQSVEALRDAIVRFESCEAGFDRFAIRKHAEGFSRTRFENALLRTILKTCCEQDISPPLYVAPASYCSEDV